MTRSSRMFWLVGGRTGVEARWMLQLPAADCPVTRAETNARPRPCWMVTDVPEVQAMPWKKLLAPRGLALATDEASATLC